MAYLKPPWFVRKIFNRVAMATGVGNSQTLTVTKRVSKQPQQIPVVVPEVGGVKYLVSTRGEAEWVRNVRADPNVKLGDTKYVATEVPVEGATFMKGAEEVEWNPRVAMGARGGLIVELIEPVSGEVDFYRRLLPKNGGVLGFHHLAMLLPLGDESWSAVEKLLADHGLSFEYTILIPDRARLAYVDTTQILGHYIELCQLQKADTDFFSGLIAESA